MSQTTTPQTSSSPTPSTGRSLLSRLASPLRSRTRNLADFHILPSEPHRQYSPGDVVKGLVVLTVVKPIRITHLTVALHGFVRVFKTPNSGTDAPALDPALTPGSNGKKAHYFGNGNVSLFQDEVVLCGEGRLEIGVYEFEFDLEFPGRGLPSSIDFERGSISYIIRATITRPTSIAATSSCDRKISLVETVDIGPMVPPEPHTIFLEPLSKKSKNATKSTSSKTKLAKEKEAIELGNVSQSSRPTSSPNSEESVSQRPSSDHGRIPRSPITSDVHSETSGESVVSSDTGMSFRLGTIPSSKSTRDVKVSTGSSYIASKTVTATVELLKGGCLPGDSIPLRVSIHHTKFIKSLHGIIITLYRQGRIDSAPPLSLFTDVKGKAAEKLKHEEYYPKSKTGLGGLSLSSAGSSHAFRKDMSQVFAPIIIDPSTLSTVVSASIRVPEDVFPTITGVPGQMISFRYYIEVVIDLGGKLAGQDKHLPRFGMINVPSNFSTGALQMNGREGRATPGMVAAWGGSIIDTDHIRREKSVVGCLFEIIVGTTDSARLRGRGNVFPRAQNKSPASPTTRTPILTNGSTHERGSKHEDIVEETSIDPNYSYYNAPQYPTEIPNAINEPAGNHYSVLNQDLTYQPQHRSPTFVPVAPPEIQSEEGLTEKERVRRAEERLLPSQPPQADGPSSTYRVLPTAPEDPYEDSCTAGKVPVHTTDTTPIAPSAPDLYDSTPHVTAVDYEDKQELERRRLMADVSSPSDFPVDHENAGEESTVSQHEPTAPDLSEEDGYGAQYAGIGANQEGLPKYER